MWERMLTKRERVRAKREHECERVRAKHEQKCERVGATHVGSQPMPAHLQQFTTESGLGPPRARHGPPPRARSVCA